MRTKHRQLPLSTHQPRSPLSFFFLSLYRFLRLSPVISRSNGCDVTSCLVFSRAASDYRSSSLLTAVSEAGNMQINGVKGQSSLIVSVCKPLQLLFKATLESLNIFSLLSGMWFTLMSFCECTALLQVSPNQHLQHYRCTNHWRWNCS